MAVYTHNYAAEILDSFENLLNRHGIVIPSDEDDQRGADNDAALYGMVYAELFDEVETILAEAANRATREDVIVGVFE